MSQAFDGVDAAYAAGHADGYRAGLEAAAKLACRLCRKGLTADRIGSHRHEGGELNGAYLKECKAFAIYQAIRALPASAPAGAEGGAQ